MTVKEIRLSATVHVAATLKKCKEDSVRLPTESDICSGRACWLMLDVGYKKCGGATHPHPGKQLLSSVQSLLDTKTQMDRDI